MSISKKSIQQKCAQEPWMTQTHGHIKFGKIPEWLEEFGAHFAADSKERQSYFAAAETARHNYRSQIRKTFNLASFADPQKVVDLCKKEPWTTAQSLDSLSDGDFGFVTEKLERARDLFPEDTKEYRLLDDAFEKAKLVYFEHIHAMSKSFAAGKTRAQVEEMNSKLWGWASRVEGDGTFLRQRLIRICELNGDYQRSLGKPNPHDPTKRQFVMRLK